jgi:cell fate (sporulation/competence/biofilm development) regulator YlbF (YheA/YmcA/DUF963 family)
MKNPLFVVLLFLATIFGSCKQDSSSATSIEQMQQQLNASPNVAKYREVFNAHTMALVSFTPAELQNIHAKMQECGLFPGSASLSDLEKCLVGIPNSAQYVEAERLLKESNQLEKILAKEFPEIWQLDAAKRAPLLLPLSEQEAEEVISNRSKNNK